ncbi:MAG: hypothetical protein ACI9GM_001668, partial [Salibacteraceae bacterium]
RWGFFCLGVTQGSGFPLLLLATLWGNRFYPSRKKNFKQT